MTRRQNRLPLFDVEVRDLLFDLRLEFVGRTLEFVQVLAHLARDLRQLLRPKDDEGQKEQEDRLRKTHADHHTVLEEHGAIAETKN